MLDLLVVAGVIALIGLVLSASNSGSHKKSDRIRCVNNLKSIGLGLRVFANDHRDLFPQQLDTWASQTDRKLADGTLGFQHFLALSNILSSPKVLVCPADNRVAAESFARFSPMHVSYFLGLDAQESNAVHFLAGDRNITNGTVPFRSILTLQPTGGKHGWTHELHNQMGNIVKADGSVQRSTTESLGQEVRRSTNWNGYRLWLPGP